jgi:hypothetical protein
MTHEGLDDKTSEVSFGELRGEKTLTFPSEKDARSAAHT